MRNTETMTVPVIVGWKCRECGRKNAVRTDMTVDYPETAEKSWAETALNLIVSPGDFSRALRESIDTDECKCPQCGNFASRAGEAQYLWLLVFLIPAMLICTVIGFLTGSAGAWIALFIFSGMTVCLLIIYFIRRFVRGGESAEQDPVLITFNREVLECAERRGIDLLTEDRLDDTYYLLAGRSYRTQQLVAECRGKTYNRPAVQRPAISRTVSASTVASAPASGAIYCYKCGKKLVPGGNYCAYCGARKLIEN